MSQDGTNDVTIKAFLLNKAARYEHYISQGGTDLRKDEVKALIETITKSENEMYERRKKIEGFDFIAADGKTPDLVKEAVDSYILGHYQATIALSGMAAERLLYDFIDFVEIRIQDKIILDSEQKAVLYKMPFNRLIEFFWRLGSLNDKTKNQLNKIAEIRNEYVHPQQTQKTSEVAIKILNLLCNVLEEKLSLFKFYDLKDGRFVLKHQKG
jgi:DNA-binding Xre family transcriptional regulator